MREIEVIRCWDDKTWDTEMVEVEDSDLEADDCELRQIAEERTLEQLSGSANLPVYVGLYWVPEEEDT